MHSINVKKFSSVDTSNYRYTCAIKKRMRVVDNEPTTTPELMALPALELVRICGESPAHPAWEEFHRRYDKLIKIYVRKSWKTRMINSDMDLTGAQELLRDLTQDVYVNLLNDEQQALRSFKGLNEVSFLAYLSRIACNVVAEHFRKQLADKRKGQVISMEFLLEDRAAEQAGSRGITYNYLSHKDEQELLDQVTINELLTLLDEMLKGHNLKRDKMIFQLYAIDGLSTQQIAALPGVELKVSSVESIIRRVKDRLRQLFQSRPAPWRRAA